MKISSHLLYDAAGSQVDFRPTPNKGGLLVPQYLVMHYTAATEAAGSISWFMSSQAQASAHLLIGRDGAITQFAPFNVVTWHAGKSSWNGLIGMNQYAIGIELVNGGKLVKTGNSWICPVDKKEVPAGDVVLAKHKNENEIHGWQAFTQIQLQTAMEIGALLVRTYQLKDVVGHDDIAPFRKTDPGPAFPMASFRSRVMGRMDGEEDLYEVNAEGVNIRAGAGTQYSPVTGPLAKGTRVSIHKREGSWSFAEVLDTVHGLNDVEGWIFSKYLDKK